MLALVAILQPESKVLPYFTMFTVGIAAAQYAIPFPRSVPAWSLWIGKQAYSLYLTNWLVLVACTQALGVAGVAPAVPLILAASWLCWRFVEKPSIALSRAVGKRAAFRVS
jgi:peptidoglycan/LPS O-acetylase OafA/YrhL